VTAETDCNLGGWKKTDQGSGVLTGQANSQCGNTGPNTPPACEGIVTALNDFGYTAADHKHSVTTTFSDASWSVANQQCNYAGAQLVTLSVTSQGCTDEFCCGGTVLTECQEAQGDFNQTTCECNFATPIVLDVKGDGFQLTDFAHGVLFDLTSSGILRQMSWTAVGSDDAFLVLDRNNNGLIDGGAELFGNYTPTPGGPTLNGFMALATFDSNGDGQINADDSTFAKLQLWTDRNHDGQSDSSELVRLVATDITSISVDYRESRRKDNYGNLFRFRAPVAGLESHFAYDVSFLLSDSAAPMSRSRR
jgi:hypothetical protein